VLAETLLGEKILDHWIGEISVEREKKGFFGIGKSKGNGLPLSELQNAVKDVIREICTNLPEKPHYQGFEKAQYSLLELKPRQSEDYPGRRDEFVHTTLNAELFMASLRQGFSSERFSRNKETFCYLKIDGSEGLNKSAHARGEIEDAINELLVESKTGCTIGGGTGLRYSYIDLALLEFTKTTRSICELLRQIKLPRLTWMLFMDADYAGEWIGLYEDTPAPPMEAE
jgi:hypothetical protein